MAQEDDLRALGKIMDFLRAVSIILAIMNVYWYCYEAMRMWGVTIGVVDRILINFNRTGGLFHSILYTKLFSLLLLALSCLGTKGVKAEKMSWNRIWTVLAVGFFLFFLNWWILLLPISYLGNATLYIFTMTAGYICLLMGGLWNNKNLQSYIDIDQIINMQLSVTNIRPISKKWLLLTTVGAGVYTSSDVKLKNVLGQGGVIFIRQFKSNLSLGAGLAVNNTFGYPMVFPAIYFDWSTEGRYQIKVSMLNAMEVSAGMKMNKYLNLRIVAEMNGSLALLEREGKDTMFSQQFIIVGLQPEVSMGNSFSITATAGVSCSRIAYYTTRTLKAFFEDMSKDTDPYFKPAMYVSVGMKYKF